MKKNLLIFFLAIPFLGFSQKTTDTIHSQKLNEDREITISLPFSYAQNKTKKYPLLIILDGDYLLDPFEGALKYGAYWDDMPEVIIVGITQNQKNERESDCTIDFLKKKEKRFLNLLAKNYCPTCKKITERRHSKLLRVMM